MESKRFRMGLSFAIFLVIVIGLGIHSETRFEKERPSEFASEKLAYVTSSGIYLASADGSGQTFLGRSLGGSAFTNVRWSPDGTQIAYNVGDLWWSSTDLYVLNVDGKNSGFLTEVPPNAFWGWSPDGQYIYISKASHMSSVWYALVQVETGQTLCEDIYFPMAGEKPSCAPVKLADGSWWSGYDASVAQGDRRWALAPTVDSSKVYERIISPNEEWVAFSTYNYSNSRRSWYIARSDGTEWRTIYTTATATQTFCYDAAWSPDSQNLAFGTSSDGQASIWIASPTDGSVSLLTRFEEEGCPDCLKWSIGGQHIGFSVYGHWSRRWIVSLYSGEITPISPEESFEVYEWSPNGNWVGCVNNQSVAVFRLTDGRRFDITTVDRPGLARAGNRLAWSSTGRWFAVSTRAGIYSFDTVTHKIRQVTAQEVRGFSWSPSSSEK